MITVQTIFLFIGWMLVVIGLVTIGNKYLFEQYLMRLAAYRYIIGLITLVVGGVVSWIALS